MAFVCNISDCGCTFGSKHNLKTHVQRVHQKERNYPCTVEGCGLSFYYNSELQRHIKRVHFKERNFCCDVLGCDRAFYYAAELNAHYRKAHERIPNYICNIDGCNKEFFKQYDFIQHVERTHQNSKRDTDSPIPLAYDDKRSLLYDDKSAVKYENSDTDRLSNGVSSSSAESFHNNVGSSSVSIISAASLVPLELLSQEAKDRADGRDAYLTDAAIEVRLGGRKRSLQDDSCYDAEKSVRL